MKFYLWEILVPTVHRKTGKPVRTRYHRVWDTKIREISSGLTIMPVAKGHWVSLDNELFVERMIPVRIMCNEQQIQEISDFTAKYYDQLAVMYYKVSDLVVITHYS